MILLTHTQSHVESAIVAVGNVKLFMVTPSDTLSIEPDKPVGLVEQRSITGLVTSHWFCVIRTEQLLVGRCMTAFESRSEEKRSFAHQVWNVEFLYCQ